MLSSKIDLFGQNWIDTIFEGRNKQYGAYELRSKESRFTVWAAILGAVLFSLLVSTPLIMKQIGDNRSARRTIDEKITMVDLLPPPEENKLDEYIPPPPPKEIKSLKDVKKFTPPVVAPDNEVVEELVKQDDLKKADAGAANIQGSADGEVVIDEKPVEQVIVEDNEIHSFQTIQVLPEYPGGMEEFDKYIIRNLRGLDMVETPTLRIQIRFVVEKDGSLTHVEVLRDGGYPSIGKNLVKLFENSPKWKPGIYNGQAARVSYIKPVTIRMQ